MRVHRVAFSVVLLAACERAGQPVPAGPPAPSVESLAPEPLAPEPIVSEHARVERPPPAPPLPGAAWFRGLAGDQRRAVDSICRIEHRDPCAGLLPLPRGEVDPVVALWQQVGTADRAKVERHCQQIYGRRAACDTPLVVAFGGERVAFRTDGRAFAFRGAAVVTDWPTADTPWLALDRDGDGMITRGDELFGDAVSGARDGFEALAQLDANGDGVIDRDDPAFASLVLWADRDGDRRGTPDELTPLAEVARAIPLAHTSVAQCTAHGDCEGERGTLVRNNGAPAAVIDVYLPERN